VFLTRAYSRQAGVPEDAFPDSPLGNVFGYGQSKWAAESLVRQAQARGAHVVIYRPGSILGATDGGFWSPRDLATVFTSHELATGKVNEEGRVLEGLPVDVVSRFIEASSADPAACGQTFHLIHPRPIGAERWAEALTRRGVPAQRVNNEEWIRGLAARAENEMYRPLFELRGIGVNATLLECLPELPSFDPSNFQRQLAAYDIACPNYDALIEQGWLDALLPK
jgi:thioester reductase-like protein